MQNSIIIQVPAELNLENTINFIKELYKLPKSDHYIIDFERMSWIEPFALLYLAYEIMRHRSLNKGVKYQAINFKNGTSKTYAAFMGFFRAFGLNYGMLSNESNGSFSYIPIRIININTIIRRASEKSITIGNYLETYSRKMACVLTRDNTSSLTDTIEFSLREILRNIVEHSNAKQLAYCAQYWPTKNIVELAILDSGIGIRESLKENPYLNIASDKDALYLSLLPGISGKMYRGKKSDPYDEWQNSGYGLYMTSELCRNGGNFFICSNTAGVLLVKDSKKDLSTDMHGTAVRLTLNTEYLMELKNAIAIYRKKGIEIAKQLKNANVTPSKASTVLLGK